VATDRYERGLARIMELFSAEPSFEPAVLKARALLATDRGHA
jgi:hypothetical protein